MRAARVQLGRSQTDRGGAILSAEQRKERALAENMKSAYRALLLIGGGEIDAHCTRCGYMRHGEHGGGVTDTVD